MLPGNARRPLTKPIVFLSTAGYQKGRFKSISFSSASNDPDIWLLHGHDVPSGRRSASETLRLEF